VGIGSWELSHFTCLTRLEGMGRDIPGIALAAVVALHLLVSLVHGSAHGTAGVGGNGRDYVVPHARMVFEVTALMLVLSEAAGSVLGFSYGRSRRTEPSYIS
jgi:hypothetical protein